MERKSSISFFIPLLFKSSNAEINSSSVVPEKNPFIEGSFESEKVLYVSNQIKLGCGIDYTKPESIGADRLANTVGAIHFIGAPAIVVDFGTALTFDVISREKAYIGGVIAPGLAAMTDYMHDNTALLPKIDLNEPLSVIGKRPKPPCSREL